ncbi:ABC transporter permease [Streptomyces sp. NPDC003697]
MRTRQWARDLGMGVRFALAGGREGWVRAVLTAVGVGLGVALLLLTTALPGALSARHDREQARQNYTYGPTDKPRADDTLVMADSDTEYHDREVRGRLVEPEGPRAPVVPGLTRYPAPGEMVVSPALGRLLDSPGGARLRERLPYRIVGTIGENGLVGSQELAYYAGAEGLASKINGWQVGRIDAFGSPDSGPDHTDPVLLLLTLVVFVVLLMPVAVFVATAVRFGGERRDRRLAALRLVGSDGRMTRRIAAGEALAGALLGLLVGAVFFLAGRRLAGSVEVFGVSVWPSYLNPSPLLAVLVALLVPAAAVLVTLFALRHVVIEPLGVVRTAKPSRRRLWWRLLLPAAGLGLLYPMVGQGRAHGDFNQYLVTGGVLLLLVGVTALLPWVVEAVVARLGSGSVSWQLAVRRLQVSSGTAARLVNGIAVAVAGAIALQMLFAGVESDYTEPTAYDLTRAQVQVSLSQGLPADGTAAAFAATPGVRHATVLSEGYVGDRPAANGADDESRVVVQTTIGDCAALREVAALPSCRDGDAFFVQQADDPATAKLARPGRRLWFDLSPGSGSGPAPRWTVPANLRRVRPVEDPSGGRHTGFLATPAALPDGAPAAARGNVWLRLDDSVPDVRENVRDTAARVDPLARVAVLTQTTQSDQFTSLRTGLFVGASCVLALIGASLLVSQLEQLRERRKLLSCLVAFGTRRRTLGLSVLWQTAVPIALGLLLASAVGMTLGAVLLRMTDTSVRVDWAGVLSMTGIGAAVVLAVTLLSLPPLLRLMRPDGLRTE